MFKLSQTYTTQFYFGRYWEITLSLGHVTCSHITPSITLTSRIFFFYIYQSFQMLQLQLTPEQHGFGLHRSTRTRVFFNKYTVGPPYPQVMHLPSQPTMDGKQLGICGCGGLTVCCDLYRFMNFGIHERFWNQFPTHSEGGL